MKFKKKKNLKKILSKNDRAHRDLFKNDLTLGGQGFFFEKWTPKLESRVLFLKVKKKLLKTCPFLERIGRASTLCVDQM